MASRRRPGSSVRRLGRERRGEEQRDAGHVCRRADRPKGSQPSDVLMLYVDLLGAEGYRLRVALRSADARRAAKAELPSAAIVDLHLSDGDDGGALAASLAARGAPIVVATAYGGEVTPEMLRRMRPVAVLQKPVAPEGLLAAVRRAVGGSMELGPAGNRLLTLRLPSCMCAGQGEAARRASE